MLKVSSCIHKYPPIWAKDSPGKLALIHPESGRQLMYGQLIQEINKKAQGLLKRGINPGDRVLSLLPLDLETVILFYACAQIGAIYVPLGMHLDQQKYLRLIKKSRPSLIFFSQSHQGKKLDWLLEHLALWSQETGALVQLNCSPGTCSDIAISWDQFWKQTHSWRLHLSQSLSNHSLKLDKQIHAWSPLLMVFERENEKGILLCHENLISQTLNLHVNTGMQRQTKTLVNSGPGTIYAYIHGICSTLTLGGTVVLSEQEDPIDILRLMDSYCISFLIQEASQYEAIWKVLPPKVGQHPYLQYALVPISVQNPLFPTGIFCESMKLFSPAYGTGLGYLESGGFISFCQGELLEKCPDKEFLPFQVKDDHLPLSIREPMRADGSCGSPINAEELGQVCIHAPNVFLGYFHEPGQTGRVLSKEGILYSPMRGFMRTYRQERLLILQKTPHFSPPLQLERASIS